MQSWRQGELETQLGGVGERLVPNAAVATALLRKLLADFREDERRIEELAAHAQDDRLDFAMRRVELATKRVRLLAAIVGPYVRNADRQLDIDWLAEINTGIRSALEEYEVSGEAIDAAVESVVVWFADKTGLWEPLGVPRPD